jgi:lincosamide nucleotidyltransferase A/C/D/E
MEPSDVVFVVEELALADVPVVVDGGWGVDALVGRKTRDHDDLDLAIDRSLVGRAVEVLSGSGFALDRDARPGLPARVVLRDENGRRVDFHPLVFDADGNGWQQLDERAWGLYPAGDIGATGRIGEREVRCISAELQLRHHLGYDLGETDMHDLTVLRERFGIPLPPP